MYLFSKKVRFSMKISHTGNGTVKGPNKHCKPELEKPDLEKPDNELLYQILLNLKFSFYLISISFKLKWKKKLASAKESLTEHNPAWLKITFFYKFL